ncbi:MAG TPA: bifunctional (p)ppGpp synthetase/guanosine-3',5'-bis(diphosphate) 3'-pyrophosphohydrolase [Candidatus Acidoferrales bacterium]
MMASRGSSLSTSKQDRATTARFEEVYKQVEESRPGADLSMLRRAYAFSAEHHRQQVRESGEPYLSHPLEVAKVLAEMKLDVTTICAGLLHDVVEDSQIPIEEVKKEFGAEVARLVEGVTKISRLDLLAPEARQAENVRKMVLAMVEDIRVVLVKLADRLHNMRTLGFLPAEKRERIARETLEIYAPLAHRLGMGKVRGELEDLALSFLEPETFHELAETMESKRKVNERFLEEVRASTQKQLAEAGIPAKVEGRIKRIYSLYQKMKQRLVALDQVFDLMAVRVLTDTVKNCYAALGVIHQAWRPVPGRFKDYIAMPRPNLYQSLHTTVVTATGQPFEVQIRTHEMHRIAEEGIAAHWKYKDGKEASAQDDQRIAWLRHLVEWAREMQQPGDFLSTLKLDLYPEEVYAFTPKGRILSLPRDATPVDFAYAVHTEVGHQCIGAKVNGRIVPLRTRLQNGDVVEILTQAGRGPSRDWLSFVKTSRARGKIRHWLSVHERQRAIELGKKIFEKCARRYAISLKKYSEQDFARLAHEHHCQNGDDLYANLGYGRWSARQVLSKLAGRPLGEPRPEEKASRLASAVKKVLGIRDAMILVKGHGDLMVYRARCCNPIRGEEIIGYITRGKGVAVHASHCRNVQNLLYGSERSIGVEWTSTGGDAFPVRLSLATEDRPGLLKEISSIISDEKLNIKNLEARTGNQRAQIDLSLDIMDRKQLERIIASLKRIPGVYDVIRLPRP